MKQMEERNFLGDPLLQIISKVVGLGTWKQF